MAPSPEEEEAFDFFLLLSLAKPTLPSADTTFSEGGGGFSNYQRHRYYPSTDAPPFSLLEKRSLLLLFLPSKEELTPLSLSLLVPARFPQSRLHISGEGGRE